MFIDSPRGQLDRGWDPRPVLTELDRCGVPAVVQTVHNESDLERTCERFSGSAYWPLNYTFDGSFDGPLIVAQLEKLGCTYIGCNSLGAQLTSKFRFKSALQAAGLNTLRWREILPDSLPSAAFDFEPPFYVKTEFTCDSAGVRRVTDVAGAQEAFVELKQGLRDRIYIEENGGTLEVTVGCIVSPNYEAYAPMQMRPIGRSYIDQYAKHHNYAIEFLPAPADVSSTVVKYVKNIVQALQINGYFRIDTVLNSDGRPAGIDLNIFPILNSGPEELSYLPMAFMMTHDCTYSDVIKAIVGTASGGAGSAAHENISALSYVRSSALLSTPTSTGEVG